MPDKTGDIALKVLDLAKKKADQAEVMYQDSESRGVHFQDNRLKTAAASATRGVGVRVIHKGRLGFSSTNDLDSLDRLVANALDSAAFGQEARFQLPGKLGAVPEVKLFDPAVPNLGMDRAAEIMRAGIDRILHAYPDAHCGGGIGTEFGHTVLVNSAGLYHEELSSNFGLGVGGFLVRGESFLWVDEGEESSRVSEQIARHADKVIDWIRLSEKEVRIGEEKLPVLFTPHSLDFLLSTFEVNTNGKTVQKGASVLANRIGEKVLDERVTIWDDPLADYAAGSLAVDSEGIVASRRALFERGVLNGFIYDLQTAGMLGAQSTGSAMRGYSSAPHPGFSNVRLAPGESSYAEILSGIRRGLLIDAALGAGQSNVLAGEFSVNVELGFLIENGQITGRVKDCMLAGNAFDAFNRIRAISRETEWHGSSELPYICFDALSVAGRGG